MAQAFVTTYQNHFRWHGEQERVKACRPVDPNGIVLPMDESWITEHIFGNQQEVDDENQLIDEKLKKQRQDILQSVYQVDYTNPNRQQGNQTKATSTTSDPTKKVAPEFDCQLDGIDEVTDDELLNYGRKLYEPKLPLQKVLAPLVGTRKIFGFLRPSHCYTPLTTYQKLIGQVGYGVLKDRYVVAKTKLCGTGGQAAETAAGNVKGPAEKQPKIAKKRKNKCKECCKCCHCYRGGL